MASRPATSTRAREGDDQDLEPDHGEQEDVEDLVDDLPEAMQAGGGPEPAQHQSGDDDRQIAGGVQMLGERVQPDGDRQRDHDGEGGAID